MATKITLRTKLKRGNIVRAWGTTVLGVVVRHEKILKGPGYYALNKLPGDRKFIKENGVDWYSRHHISDLVFARAQIITRDELVAMNRKGPSRELEILIKLTKRHKGSR